MTKTESLLLQIRKGQHLTRRDQLSLVVRLAAPSMMAGIANVAMNFIDAAMVGRLGATAAASIALMSPSVWLFTGLCMCVANGFGVQVAHLIGADDASSARNVLRQSLLSVIVVGLFIMLISVLLSEPLPIWLGGGEVLQADATNYYSIFSLFIPLMQVNWLCTVMLRCSGDIKHPSIANVLMCLFDVIFNFLLIYPTRELTIGTLSFNMPGAGLGIQGAALGTGLASLVAGIFLFRRLFFLSPELNIRHNDISSSVIGFEVFRSYWLPQWHILCKAFRIALPMALQHLAICLAQIATIVIVAPLGAFAVAAHGFGITAESFCYLPGYAMSNAVTTLVGQSVGAGRRYLARSFAYIAVLAGMVVMGVLGGVALYWGGDWVLSLFTPVQEIVSMGVPCLHIEAFAEPMFAASIVAYGACVGAGDTVKPALMNLLSMWGVRITLALLLTPYYGLLGVWLAMAIELTIRGGIFLCRIGHPKWLDHAIPLSAEKYRD